MQDVSIWPIVKGSITGIILNVGSLASRIILFLRRPEGNQPFDYMYTEIEKEFHLVYLDFQAVRVLFHLLNRKLPALLQPIIVFYKTPSFSS